ncbi:hypothetical protein CWE07_01435 [Aliidiomarina maris]|uniref:Outer membrane protein with beta-barrel domain n=2 Tax=Aliidiomarina maris TaxID=531312 RepID=A0A327X467_9GAMM|nr:hypothetical protein B0I24_101299 [Aliidiomarina maris]RUO28497.1 hypothetical protein CWE07_01435 [Aliidiomarina maris]
MWLRAGSGSNLPNVRAALDLRMFIMLRRIIPALTLLALTGAANAQALNLTQPSYTHVSAGVGENSRGQRAYMIDVEHEFGHKYFVTGHYENISQSSNRPRQSVIDLGVGRYFNVYDRTTLDVSTSVGNFVEGSNVFSGSGNTFYTLNGGVRQRHDALEYRLGYRYIDMSGFDSNHGVVVSAHFYFTPQTALGVYFSDVYANSNWSFGLRVLY